MEIKKYQYLPEQKAHHILLNPACIKYIILHHTACEVATPGDINRWHGIDNGWNGGAGYNYYVRKDGTIWELRGNHMGAHCLGHNDESIGIAVEGNYETEEHMPDVQLNAVVYMLKYLKPMYPNFEAIGVHGEFGKTSCPGKHFPVEDILSGVYTTNEKQFEDAARYLKEQKVINSPGYWIKANTLKQYDPDYVNLLMIKFANYLKKKYND